MCTLARATSATATARASTAASGHRALSRWSRADWTARDPAIAAELARLGRSGVPTYVLYRGQAAPQVLGEILTVDEVRSAISSLLPGALP